MNKEVKLPCYGIVVSWDSETLVGKIKTPTLLGRSIFCEAAQLANKSRRPDQIHMFPEFDGIFSMILAHAIAGVDIESPAYIEGIETAVEAVGNND